MPFKIRKWDPFLERYVYSTGGADPDWRADPDRGKTWRTIGQVKNALNNYNEYKGGYSENKNVVPKDWEIIECEMKLVLVDTGKPLVAHEVAQIKVDKDRIRRLEYKREREDAEKAELARLKAKYEEK